MILKIPILQKDCEIGEIRTLETIRNLKHPLCNISHMAKVESR